MTTIFSIIRIDGIVLTAPSLTSGNLVEFVVTDDDSAREYLVRIPRTELGQDIAVGAHVRATGSEGWIVPGRAWRREPSRTILDAHDVQLRELAFAA
jgi:hypothetical protein